MRAATDNKLIELQKKFSSLKETNERGEKSREKLSGELKDMKKKVIVNHIVRDTECSVIVCYSVW